MVSQKMLCVPQLKPDVMFCRKNCKPEIFRLDWGMCSILLFMVDIANAIDREQANNKFFGYCMMTAGLL